MSSADLRRAAVLGSPVSHSLSPVLHRCAYAALGLAGWRYDAIEADGQQLGPVVTGAGPEWVGFSVTMPGKAAAASVADRHSERVRRLGVANTLVRADGGWFAENTDVDGVIGSLRAAGVRPRRALLLGGGGTALAILAALAELGTQSVTVAGRRESSTTQALRLATEFGIPARHSDLTEEAIVEVAAGCDIVFSSLPSGAADHLADVLARLPVLFDAVYHPWPTPIAAAGGVDRVTITGLDLLLHQAFRQVELMTGLPAPKEPMRDALAAAVPGTSPLRFE